MKTNNFKVSSKLNSLSSFKSKSLPCAKLVAILIIAGMAAFFTGCDPSGSVGSDFAGSETDVRYDTTTIAELSIDTLAAYSGNLDYFSAGQFNDPLFGDITATGLLKPLLISNRDSLAFDEFTNISLLLAVNSKTVYGDTLADQSFSIYEAQRLWRANQWRLSDDMPVPADPLATFTAEPNDTLIEILMPKQWVEEYGNYFNLDESNRDSIYVREFYGLVIVPDNYGKIVTFDPDSSSMLIFNLKVENPDSVVLENPRLDSLEIPLGVGEWAYSVQRSNLTSSPASSSKLISTYERVIKFEHDFDFENIKRRNIARVEIVFYVNKTLLKQSIDQAGASAVRPESTVLNLHFLEGDELPQSLSQYNLKSRFEYARAEYSAEDNAYHFDITAQVKSNFYGVTKEKRDFYVTIGENDGIIRSGLLFNSLTTGKEPKVVVTYVEIDN